MITLYGIKNCDTVRKARKWLDSQNIRYRFHDFREDGLEKSQVQQWLSELGWESLINKRSTTWKTLSDDTKSRLNDQTAADIVIQSPTLIKRPVLDTGNNRILGFRESDYQHLFS